MVLACVCARRLCPGLSGTGRSTRSCAFASSALVRGTTFLFAVMAFSRRLGTLYFTLPSHRRPSDSMPTICGKTYHTVRNPQHRCLKAVQRCPNPAAPTHQNLTTHDRSQIG